MQRLISFQSGQQITWTLIITLAIVMRVCLVLSEVPLSGDALTRYHPLATNLLAGHGFSSATAPPYYPNHFDQPGYPAFLALIFWYANHSLRAVILAQIVLELGTVMLAAQTARALGLSRRVQRLTIAIGLLCPFLALWSTRIMTETLATFVATLACYAFVRAAEPQSPKSELWWMLAGLTGGAGLLVRPDMVIAIALMAIAAGLVAIIAGLRQGGWRPLARAVAGPALFTMAGALVLAPWTLRNAATFWRVRPWGTVSDLHSHGYVRWLGTWVDDTRYQQPYWWDILKPTGPRRFPWAKISNDEERKRVRTALDLARRQRAFEGQPAAEFAALAEAAKRRDPWRCQVVVSMRRVGTTWLRLPEYAPLRFISVLSFGAPVKWQGHVLTPIQQMAQDVLQRYWLMLLGCMAAGTLCALLSGRCLLLIPFALILGRSLLPFISGIATEPRYLVEALPMCFILTALGIVLLEAVFCYFRSTLPISLPSKVTGELRWGTGAAKAHQA